MKEIIMYSFIIGGIVSVLTTIVYCFLIRIFKGKGYWPKNRLDK